VSFTDYLIVLYALDVIWLGSMQLLSAIGESRRPWIFQSMVRKDDMAPFQWALVNIVLGVTMWGLLELIGHPAHIPDWKLYVLLMANVFVFFYDLIVIAYGIRDTLGAVRPSSLGRP
jgi:hypothetical protein